MFLGMHNIRALSGKLINVDKAGNFEYLNALESFELLSKLSLSEFKVHQTYCNLQLVITDDDLGNFVLRCFVILDHYQIEIFDLDELGDYIVNEHMWAPISQGSKEEVAELVKKAGCASFGKITPKQYLYLSVHGRSLTPSVKLEATNLANLVPEKLENSYVLNAIPYQYQQDGFEWLSWLRAAGLGGLLGDEMGLGKTLQVIMLLQSQINEGKSPNLVICPPSLLENWRREIKRFINIDAYIHQGDSRHFEIEKIAAHAIVVASYDAVRRDSEYLQKVSWNIIAADEAQYIKNHSSQRTVAVKQLPKSMGIAVSGTPIENSLTDLWSLIDFAIPDFLGNIEWFKTTYVENTNANRDLKSLIRPLVLRRRVLEVADDLPSLTIKPQPIPLPEELAVQYNLDELDDSGTIMSAFRRISNQRKICNHISLTSKVDLFLKPNGKIEYIRNALEELTPLGMKALLFAPYTRTLENLAYWYKENFPGSFIAIINGATPIMQRQIIVDEFSEFEGAGLLVMNPKAAGVGLNMTAANHVFHFSPDWNPAVIDQATARSYRRGQTLPVTVHNLFYEGTVEEYMNSRLEVKRALSEETLDETKLAPSLKELNEALRLRPRL